MLLAGVLLAANLLPDAEKPADQAIECVRGAVDVVGSSAFAPVMTTVADRYTQACDGATVRVTATGSVSGVRQLAGVAPASRATMAAMSDGKVGEATGELMAQLRPGPSLPIRIVGRGQESGSRRAFEQTVLGATSEGALTSDSCETTDRIPGAPVIRCERGTEAQQINEIASTPGAIGYVDLPSAGPGLTTLSLDGERPSVSGISAGYPFWTVEYLYTKGIPPAGSLLAAFVDHLRGPASGTALTGAGYTPCTGKDGQLHLLCQS